MYSWLEMESSDPQNETQQFLVLRQVRDLPEALLFKTILDSAGIDCLLGDENTIRMDWLWSNLLGGIKLWVRKADADAASSLLEQRVPEGFEVEGVGEFQQPRCPKCQSLNISLQGLNKQVAYTSVFLGVPVPLQRTVWECESCGYQWPDSNDKPLNKGSSPE